MPSVVTWWSVWQACGEADPAAPPVVAAGWLDEVAYHPEAFAALTAEHRDGWVALHDGDALAASRAFGTGEHVGATRAAIALATWHDDVATLTAGVHAALWARWSEEAGRSGAAPLPPDAAWLALVSGTCAAADPGPAAPDDVRAHFATHRTAREEGDTERLAGLGEAPVRVVPGGGFERRSWDPCVDAALAEVWTDRATGGTGAWTSVRPDPQHHLAWTFLAAWPTVDAWVDGVQRGESPGYVGPGAAEIDALGVTEPGATADEARDRVARLGAALDAVGARVLDQAPAEGSALVAELGLVERWREALALAFARRALQAGHPTAAAVWLRSVARPGTGLRPAPSVGVLLAWAELRTGHTREALAALHAVSAHQPGLRGVEDVLSDLVVLEGLGKPGDSKEDP
jgi:hypothetical protein